ncbi:MAG: NAD(P)-binding domain-containing protein, partial [Gammaproteobacteria bacterium]|nr:NAD(P)-binding domain-containing protein [Gammaproteobacteria bacterium]
GVGEFAEFLIRGLVRSRPGTDIILSPRSATRSQRLAAEHGCVVAVSNAAVIEVAGVVVLATRPLDVEAALSDLPWRRHHTVVSVAAGVSIERLTAMVAPATPVMAMLVNAAAIGASPVSMYPHNAAAQRALSSLGNIIALPNAATFEAASVLGAYYGWVFAMMANVAEWCEQQGIADTVARELVAGTVRAAAAMVRARSGDAIAVMVEELRTPGGLTEHGLQYLDEREALTAWSDACAAVLARLSQPY